MSHFEQVKEELLSKTGYANWHDLLYYATPSEREELLEKVAEKMFQRGYDLAMFDTGSYEPEVPKMTEEEISEMLINS